MTSEEVRKRIAAGEDSRTQFKRESIGVAKLAAELTAFTNAEATIFPNVPVNVPVSLSTAEKVEQAIQMNPGINRKRLATLCGLAEKTIGRQIKLLQGRVEFRGAPKTGGYYALGGVS